MKTVLLQGFFGHDNLGDDLLLYESLNRIPNGYNIYVQGTDMCKSFKKIRNINIVSSKWQVLKNRYDYIIIPGGGVFPSSSYSFKSLLYAYFLRSRAKFVIYHGIGICPKNGFLNRFRFSLLLRMCNYISVRDDVSKYFVNTLVKTINCQNCGDLIFGRELTLCKRSDVKREGALLCLTYPFSDEEMKIDYFQERYRKYVSIMQKICLFLTNRYSRISFISFYKDRDIQIYNDLIANEQLKTIKLLRKDIDYSYENVDLIFQQYEIGINMRFHSFVLSIRNRLPFLGICYDYKSESMMEKIGLLNTCVKYGIRKGEFFDEERDLVQNEICDKLNFVINNQDYIEKEMDDYRLKMYDSVNKSYDLILNKFNF